MYGLNTFHTYANGLNGVKAAIYFREKLEKAGFTILNSIDAYNENYSIIFLLSEGHVAIHTLSDAGKTYIEITTSNMEAFTKLKYSIDILPAFVF